MSHSQIQAPKHYREQVIQALKKKYLQIWQCSQHKPIHLPQEVSRHVGGGGAFKTKDSESP